MQRFTNRVAFITGAGHGIGTAVARRIHSEGGAVVLADIDEGACAETAQALGPDRTLAVACDLTDRNSVDAAVAAADQRFGRLDALVNVAGGTFGVPALEDGLTDEQWDATVELNLTGAMRAVRAAVPLLRRQGGTDRGGAIVLIGSVNGLAAFGDEAYSASKAGLSAMAKTLAVRLGPEAVRVNVVAPGTIRTRVWEGRNLDRITARYPLGRIGEPEDIAAAVAFLASDDGAWVTGITLPVEGGILAAPR